MKSKYFKLSLILFVALNIFLVWTGVFLPWLISTNQLPLTLIFMILTGGILVIFTGFFYCLEKVNKKKIIKIPCATRTEMLFQKGSKGNLTNEEKLELSEIIASGNYFT
jgi:hypothetical protein